MMLGVHSDQRFLSAAVVAVALLSVARLPALGEPITEEARQIIEEKLLHAAIMSNARRALKFCREAEQTAAGYDRDAYYDGAIATCLGYAEMHLHNNPGACVDLARAVAGLEAVRPDDPRYVQGHKWRDSIRNDRPKIGC